MIKFEIEIEEKLPSKVQLKINRLKSIGTACEIDTGEQLIELLADKFKIKSIVLPGFDPSAN